VDGQVTGTGADLDHGVASGNAGGGRDGGRELGVFEEMLAQVLVHGRGSRRGRREAPGNGGIGAATGGIGAVGASRGLLGGLLLGFGGGGTPDGRHGHVFCRRSDHNVYIYNLFFGQSIK